MPVLLYGTVFSAVLLGENTSVIWYVMENATYSTYISLSVNTETHGLWYGPKDFYGSHIVDYNTDP